MTQQWEIIEPKRHTVRFEVSHMTGAAKVLVDGCIIWQRGWTFFSDVLDHQFRIDDVNCRIRVTHHALGSAEFWHDGKMM